MAKKTATSKKRNVKVDAIGQLHVHSSFNNIIVSLKSCRPRIIRVCKGKFRPYDASEDGIRCVEAE